MCRALVVQYRQFSAKLTAISSGHPANSVVNSCRAVDRQGIAQRIRPLLLLTPPLDRVLAPLV